MDRSILRDIHRYWFGNLKSPDDVVAEERTKEWFRPTPAIDDHIRDTFGRYLDPALATEWHLAELSRAEQVGLVVLLDQFPRQIFRGSGQSFAYDGKAKAIAGELLRGGVARFYPPERSFLFLPFEHSEDIADQDYCVWLTAGEAVSAAESTREGARANLDYATIHRDLIRKFGRFPHRNAMLGRQSTPEEEAFLKEHGRGY